MVTVHRARGLRIVIFLDDHEPAHVHVFGDGQAKIGLARAGQASELVWADGMTRSELRRALQVVTEQQSSCWSGRSKSMAEMIDQQLDEALERGRALHTAETRARAVRYDRQIARVIVDLTNGCTFTFPPILAQGLIGATEDELAEVEILGAGYGLHWEALDVDLSIPGLLSGSFGTKAHMDRLASQSRSVA